MRLPAAHGPPEARAARQGAAQDEQGASGWSRTNKKRVESLLAGDLMTDAGRHVIEAARADGSWSALDDSEAGIVPPDLAAALTARSPAGTEWESFSVSTRKGILQWIGSAKRPETRAKRIEETAMMAARGEKANQWERKG